MPKLFKNKPIPKDDILQLEEKLAAKEAAKVALKAWYESGYMRAQKEIPQMQIEKNLRIVASIPGWRAQKGDKNGYVMLTSLVSGTLSPVILKLDYESHPTGGLTYRQLHLQVREYFKLESRVSLRMCPDRPWYRHMQSSFPVPERRALGASSADCRSLLGTTLLYYTYVHLTDPVQEQEEQEEVHAAAAGGPCTPW